MLQAQPDIDAALCLSLFLEQLKPVNIKLFEHL